MEISPRPLDDIVIDHLMSKSSETAELDFKYMINLDRHSDFIKIVEDIFALSNYGGGHLLFGFKEKDTGAYEKAGLPDKYHIDQANLQRKFNSFSNEPIQLDYKEFEREISENQIISLKKFAILYVPPSKVVLYPIKDGIYQDKNKKIKIVFNEKDILIRRGTITDKATPLEIDYIKERIKKYDYQINILSGEPDEINENIYSNIFKVIKLPEYVYIMTKVNIKDDFIHILDKRNIVYYSDYTFLYTFDESVIDMTNQEIQKILFMEFVKIDDQFNIGKILMNLTLEKHIKKIGLDKDDKYRNVYFFGSDNGDKYVYWKSKYKKSRRYVVKYRFATKLNKYYYFHEGANTNFISINKQFYLIIIPRLILSENGSNSIHSFEHGPIITSLIHDEYNDKYLNNILFWISKLNVNSEDVFSIGNNIKIESIPQIYSLNYGIRADHPSTEFKDRKDELYSLMELVE